MLQGVKNVTDAFDNPAGAGQKMVTNYARSLVPTIIGDIAGALDDRERRPDGFDQGIQYKLPFMRNNLPEKLTPLGDPIPTTPLKMIDMFNSRGDNSDKQPVLADMLRLGIEYPAPQQRLNWVEDGKRQSMQLSVEEHNQLLEMTGDEVKRRMANVYASPAYKKAQDEAKKDQLEAAIRDGRKEGLKAFRKDVMGIMPHK
jgi:hypothetical protein